MSGYIDDLSASQVADLAQVQGGWVGGWGGRRGASVLRRLWWGGQFRTALADVLRPERHDDRYLLRFLRARAWDLPKAEAMFRDTLLFRAKWKLDTILQDYKPPAARGAMLPMGCRGRGAGLA
jgi:hypothetical protein